MLKVAGSTNFDTTGVTYCLGDGNDLPLPLLAAEVDAPVIGRVADDVGDGVVEPVNDVVNPLNAEKYPLALRLLLRSPPGRP